MDLEIRVEQSKEELYQNAQMFHFDYDSFNFLKVFIYLSDVDESNVPTSVKYPIIHSQPI